MVVPSSMKQLVLRSHALADVNAISFDDEGDFGDVKQLGKGLGADKDVAGLISSSPQPKGPKPYQDIPLPPPERPLKWQTKLVCISCLGAAESRAP